MTLLINVASRVIIFIKLKFSPEKCRKGNLDVGQNVMLDITLSIFKLIF